jgi:2-polyprenyl-6-methoxyphenol hydroxylase-like FAD-dependent oxidoreductase
MLLFCGSLLRVSQAMVPARRILIVGGGIGGLSLAVALRKVGFEPRVLEQAPVLKEVGAGVGLWSNAMASLDQLGVGDAVRRGSLPLCTVAGADPRGRSISRFDLRELGPDFERAACFVVLRASLLGSLAAALPHGSVRTACRVERLDVVDERVIVHMQDGRVEETDVLVGADGLHSVVRPHVVGPDPLRYSGQTCFRGVARHAALVDGAIVEVQGRGQRGSVCPVASDTVYWWVAHNAPEGEVIPPSRRKTVLVERYGGWPFGLPDAIAATPDDAILQNDLVDRPPARAYARGPLVLTGDAAHPTTPNLGQGANMAIDDAIALARAMRDESKLADAFERYQRERLPRTRLVVERSWSFGRMCRWDSAFGVAVREAMVRLTPGRVMRDMLRWQILDSVGSL